MLMTARGRGANTGFSLAEVTLALGIASVALLSVVGLLSLAMDTSEEAGEDTALAAMTGMVVGDLHVVPFDALGRSKPWSAMAEAAAPGPMEDSVYYFTQEGVPLSGTLAATDPKAHFECVVEKSEDEGFRRIAGSVSNLVEVKLHFTWPVSANADPNLRPGESIFHASIARY
ncbi:hypothetical protein FEM03_19925 [Phragmitibacter flavus]|uniref:Prepilin-type N-terminal cleavage/methylation domain-containing protein n=2 Tax=Phragmitibacter flavus TaxID=2576071 RepID=A0A5R8K9G2_9BACT|nr:hypothetical protein FEM03_19925 [Phragmitibacter flavus]